MGHTELGMEHVVPAVRSPYVGKRLLDLVVGLVLSVFTFPIVLVLSAISAVKFRCSPYFVQERVGLNGTLFRCIKIRSLPKTTPEYLDKTDALRRKRQGAEPISFSAETDRMYLNTDATCVLEDRGWGRKIRIAKRGSDATVVWNPWIAKAKAMPDFGDDEWPAMVCVETAAANENRLTLAARSTHTLEATYSIEPA